MGGGGAAAADVQSSHGVGQMCKRGRRRQMGRGGNHLPCPDTEVRKKWNFMREDDAANAFGDLLVAIRTAIKATPSPTRKTLHDRAHNHEHCRCDYYDYTVALTYRSNTTMSERGGASPCLRATSCRRENYRHRYRGRGVVVGARFAPRFAASTIAPVACKPLGSESWVDVEPRKEPRCGSPLQHRVHC